MSGIVFGFGRLSPPTIGHERLIQKIIEVAKKTNSDHMLYLSQSYDNKTNPLEWNFKRRICEAAFPGLNISSDKTIATPFKALESFKGIYEQVTIVAGSDRVESYERMIPYAKEWGLDFHIAVAGQRIDEAVDVSGMSSSKMREFALNENKREFVKHLPTYLTPALRELIYHKTREGLKSR